MYFFSCSFQHKEVPMEKKAIVLDIDGTMYNNPAYLKEGDEREYTYMAEKTGRSVKTLKAEFHAYREQSWHSKSQFVVEVLGLGTEWWNRIRLSCYSPEKFLCRDPSLVEQIRRLSNRYRIVAATNSPGLVGEKVLRALGFEPLLADYTLLLFGPETLHAYKPQPAYFAGIAADLQIDPKEFVSIGDREDADILPAREAGMEGILVTSRKELDEALAMLHRAQEFFIQGPMESVLNGCPTTILGITGQAGAGKRTLCRKIAEHGPAWGRSGYVLALDAFFKLSSRARREWLEEARGDEEEYARRSNQLSWWDFEHFARCMQQLREGKPLHLEGVYNRADKGELTGVVDIPAGGPRIVAVHGVALAHPQAANHLDGLWMVTAPTQVRAERLYNRDKDRRPDRKEAKQRFELTEAFERPYFQAHGKNASLNLASMFGDFYLL